MNAKSLWSGGVEWATAATARAAAYWQGDGTTPTGKPFPDVALDGALVTSSALMSMTCSLGLSDWLADPSPNSASVTLKGQSTATIGDELVISTGHGVLWSGTVDNIADTMDVNGDHWTTVTATDRIGALGAVRLNKTKGLVGDLVEIATKMAKRSGVNLVVNDVSTGTYGLPQLQWWQYWSQTFTGSLLEYVVIAARSSNAMVALQPDGSLRVMTREALATSPTTVSLTGSNAPSSWTKSTSREGGVNHWAYTTPSGVDIDQVLSDDIAANGDKTFSVDNWLDAGDTPPVLQLGLPFTDWWAYTPTPRAVVTSGEFIVSDFAQDELLTLAPLDWVTVAGEDWQVMSMTWSVDGPGQPMRLTITADDILVRLSGGTPGVGGPIISGVRSYAITDTTATITWNLDQVGTGYVEYGITTGYGSETTHETSYTYNYHVQTITGLSPGTTYHYRTRSSAPSGTPVESISADYTFTTTGSVPGGGGGGSGGSTFDDGMFYTDYVMPTGTGYTDGSNAKFNVQTWIELNVPDGTDATHHSRVIFPAGYTYTLTTSGVDTGTDGPGIFIRGRNHLTFEGGGTEGTYGSTGGATISLTTSTASVLHDEFSGFVVRPTGFGSTSAGSDIRFHGFTFQGSSTLYASTTAGDPEANEYQHGIALMGVNGCEVDHCTFDKLHGDGVYITDSTWTSLSTGYASRDVTISYNDIKNNGRMGVAIIWAINVTVKGNRFTDMAYACLDIEPNHAWEGAYGTVTFSDNLLAGKWSWDATYPDAAINITGNNNNPGTYSATFLIERNSVTGSSQDGSRFFILGDYGDWVKSGVMYVKDNTCTNPKAGPAVTMVNFSGGAVITNNTGFLSSGSFVDSSYGGNGTITQSGNT